MLRGEHCKLGGSLGPANDVASACALFAKELNNVSLSPLAIGEHHPRIWRPHAPLPERTHPSAWAASVQAAQNILAHAREVFRCVEPTEANSATFGHEIRELLMLASMEVESGWKAVLRENGYQRGTRQRWNRNDYRRLADPMRLSEWSVRITTHPGAGTLRPFEGWATDGTSLAWYDAYNAVKHDRESNMAKAHLWHALDAVAGVFIMVCAQFGRNRTGVGAVRVESVGD